MDEARITAQLEHPGIVPVHDLAQRTDGSIYYAMRMVRGRDMKKGLSGRALRERLELIPNYLDLCHAIAYAHSRGVVHRDLKPDNVMLGEFGETLVLDWGLAKVRGKEDRRMDALADEMEQLRKSSGTETVMGAPLGTPAYMPPEQAAGRLDLIDARSDVYSLGAILYELLTGRPPHRGRSALEVLEKVGQEEIVPPEQREAEAPPELGAICMRALARRPQDRYESAKLLAEDVRRFQVGGLVRAHAYSAWDMTKRWLGRHRRAIAVVTALLVVAAGMWWYRGYADAHRRARAERQRQARVLSEVEQILTAVARGPKVKNWLEVYTFKLIAIKEPLVERRLSYALSHPNVRLRRLAARSLGGMKSRQAVRPLCARLAKGVEPSDAVVVAVINALGILGNSRANDPVSKARYRYGQHGAVWRNTALAFRMIPLPSLPKTGVTAPRLVRRGQDLLNKRDLAGALALYDRAIEQDPKLIRAFANRAIVRRRLGDIEGARAAFYHHWLGLYVEAARDLGQALKLARSEEIAHRYSILLAAVALRVGDRAGAKRRLDSTVVADPQGAHGSAVLFVRGKRDRAAFVKAVPFTPSRKAYLAFLQGIRAELAGDLPAALKAYTAVLRPYRWSNFWYSLAAHNVKVLGRRRGATRPGTP